MGPRLGAPKNQEQQTREQAPEVITGNYDTQNAQIQRCRYVAQHPSE